MNSAFSFSVIPSEEQPHAQNSSEKFDEAFVGWTLVSTQLSELVLVNRGVPVAVCWAGVVRSLATFDGDVSSDVDGNVV